MGLTLAGRLGFHELDLAVIHCLEESGIIIEPSRSVSTVVHVGKSASVMIVQSADKLIVGQNELLFDLNDPQVFQNVKAYLERAGS